MNCIVTAGPTCEALDEVRRLTNFSTGKLGSDLANHLVARGHRVVLLKGYYAIHHGEVNTREVFTFTTTADLKQRLQSLAGNAIDVVFHAAAVSDFGFGKVFNRLTSGELLEVKAGKFSTRQGQLLVELVPTPKLISHLRGWFPHAQLFGWKYEVDGDRSDAIAAGVEQIRRCQTNACVVNGRAYGNGFGLVSDRSDCAHAPDASSLFDLLSGRLKT